MLHSSAFRVSSSSCARSFRRGLFALSAALLPAVAHAQLSVSWLTQYGSSAGDEAYGVAVDATGQIWVAGSTFGNLGGTSQNGQGNLFLSRLSPGGMVDFTRQRGGTLSDAGYAVALVGSSVFAGGVTSSSTFDGATALGNQDGLIVRYDSNGTWNTGGTKRLGSNLAEYLPAMAGSSTNLLVAGTTSKTFDGQTLTGSDDAYLSLRDSTGALLWTRFVGTASIESGQGAALDSAGNAYVAGSTQSAFPGFTNTGSTDLFVARYDSAGNQTLLRQIGSNATESVWDVEVDMSGNIYLTGTTQGNLLGQTQNGLGDAFVMKLGSNGVPLWTRLLGGNQDDGANALALDGAGNVWIGGYTTSSFAGHTLAGDVDGFVAAYDSNGNLLGTTFLASPGIEGVNGITVSPDGAVYAVGNTTDVLGSASAGDTDAFVAKIVPEPSVASLLLAGLGVNLRRRRRRR